MIAPPEPETHSVLAKALTILYARALSIPVLAPPRMHNGRSLEAWHHFCSLKHSIAWETEDRGNARAGNLAKKASVQRSSTSNKVTGRQSLSSSNRRAAGFARRQNHQEPPEILISEPGRIRMKKKFIVDLQSKKSQHGGDAYLLGSSKGHRRSCKGLFFLGILLLLGEQKWSLILPSSARISELT